MDRARGAEVKIIVEKSPARAYNSEKPCEGEGSARPVARASENHSRCTLVSYTITRSRCNESERERERESKSVLGSIESERESGRESDR